MAVSKSNRTTPAIPLASPNTARILEDSRPRSRVSGKYALESVMDQTLSMNRSHVSFTMPVLLTMRGLQTIMVSREFVE
jgi:hypothetical protein